MKKLFFALLVFALPHFSWAQLLYFHASLDGPQAGVASTGTGFADAVLDVPTNVLSFTTTWTGLGSLTTNGHIHRGAPGVSGPVTIPFPGIPLGATSGTYTNTFLLTPTLLNDLLTGMDYVNIHSVNFPAGEIRGQLLAAPAPGAIPEPSTYAFAGSALLGLLAFRRFRRSR
jgi:hypothetical protein